MGEVRRLFVEKQKGFDVEAQHLLQDLRNDLGLKNIDALHLYNRYDIEGLSQENFERAKNSIFSLPNVDRVYETEMPAQKGFRVFATEYLPGQYDQRADSAEQCVQLLTQGECVRVATARVIALAGEISDEDVQKIQKYLINPIESRLASESIPSTLDLKLGMPQDVAVMQGFTELDDASLTRHYEQDGEYAMSLDDLRVCQRYFRDVERRDPTITEMRVIDTYWSDHCRHTTFLTELDEITIEEGEYRGAVADALALYHTARKEAGREDKPVCMMDMATIGAKVLQKRGILDNLDESEEINACSIRVPVCIDGKEEPWLVQFKNETHNHPTEIEPFGGAATCLGGAIRDPLAGRAYVYQAMRVTGCGDPNTPYEQTLKGKLPQRSLTIGAANGYSSYGNQVGVATGQVSEIYDDGYVAKRMEVGAVVGACPEENVCRKVPQKGDVVVLVGGRTGRDGIGGATGSSQAHDEMSIDVCGSQVQKGNPPTERKLLRLFRNPRVSRMILRCNDFGAGGVSVAIGELAPGLRIDLDAIPKKYEGLDGTELAISESQERMAVVLAPGDMDAFIQEVAAENLEATKVAEVTDENRLVMIWRGSLIVDISRAFLDTNGAKQTARVKIGAIDPSQNHRRQLPEEVLNKSTKQAFLDNLKRLNVCAQKGLAERFDASIGAGSVLMPYAGRYQMTPEEGMVAKIPVLYGNTQDTTVMTYGFSPKLSAWSPFHGGAFAVVEALSKLSALGADPLSARLSFQEYFEKLSDEPKRWGKPVSALLGALGAQLHLGVPAIGGKDSMSGSFGDMDVPPTLVCFALSMSKAAHTLSAALQPCASDVYYVPVPLNGGGLPDYEALKRVYSAVYEASCAEKILSASVVREGGAAAAVVRMALGNRVGFAFERDITQDVLYAPHVGALLLQLGQGACLPEEIACTKLGSVADSGGMQLQETFMAFEDILAAYESTLEPVFATEPYFTPVMKEVPLYAKKHAYGSRSIAQPRVVIPVYPGINCEYDTERAFMRAGAVVKTIVMNNLSPSGIEQSILAMQKAFDNAQIIMLPGGFSGGDEPDGSGKFIATTLRNPRLKDAIHRFLARDGLMLGICNGFQALIKLGLVPFGEIRDIKEDDPTLTFNSLGRHVSRMVNTRVTSTLSPWLSLNEPGDVHTLPVSHGEGRFVASDAYLGQLIANHQIATQYVDATGAPSGDIQWNPNGSMCAVEGITSPDGRILGKMAHNERLGEGLFKNIPGEKDQKLFEGGVRYFE
ncbi:MAG: phosphoribosylformylglycinamidine synthase [Christensenellales bacterium]|jgi:phosphoribosylformylglycinamidine synthase